MTTTKIEDVDLFADEVLVDPYDTYAKLRETAAVVHLPSRDLYALTRYDEVRDALGDPATFTSTKVGFNPMINEVLKGTTLATDPPDHAALRVVLTENLSPRALRKERQAIDEKADTMVRELVERGSFDGVADLAQPLPLSIVADMIGVSPEIKEKLIGWGEAAMNLLGPMNERSEAYLPFAQELYGWSHNSTAADLRPGSMGHAIFSAAERGEIPFENCGMIIHQYIAAGMDTTIATIGNALNLFGENPDQFELLRNNHSLVGAAMNEVLRYHAPLPVAGRGVTRDVEVGGVQIPAGAQAAVMIASGNRDPRHYEDPDSFRIERNPIDHLGFGYGIHGCAGQGLARLEVQAALTALAKHVKSFRVAEATPRLTNMTRGWDSIRVVDVVPA